MKNILRYILARARERSSWIGLVSIATAAGLALSSEESEAVVSAGAALAGLIAVFTKDPGSRR